MQIADFFESVVLAAGAEARFARYAELLLDWGQRVSLTSIKDLPGIYDRHFVDSLQLADFLAKKPVASLLDVGAGAGFPGIPLAILFPQIRVVLVESVGKKCRFMECVVSELGLGNVEVLNGRAEDSAVIARVGRVDLVVGRAVFYLPVLLQVAAWYLPKGGYVAAYKSSARLQEELGDAAEILALCKLRLDTRIDYNLAGDSRQVLVYEKGAAIDPPRLAIDKLKKKYKRG